MGTAQGKVQGCVGCVFAVALLEHPLELLWLDHSLRELRGSDERFDETSAGLSACRTERPAEYSTWRAEADNDVLPSSALDFGDNLRVLLDPSTVLCVDSRRDRGS